MADSSVERDGLHGVAPDRDAHITPGRRRRRAADSMVPEPEFQSYYGRPILHQPTWKALDIAGYFFFGGLAGASSTLAVAASATGHPALARPLRYGAAGAITVSAAALVHDLGRPGRFYNMLRVLKPSSPMSVGSWILAAYGPAAIGAALPLPAPLGAPLSVAAAALGPAVATYTAVLVSDTAVPAWHEGYCEMPFLFAGSAAAAASGLGLVTTPVSGAGPARRLGVIGATAELAVGRVMRRRMGMVGEVYEQGRAGRLVKAAEALSLAGIGLAVAGRRSRAASAAAGVCWLAGSALTRFGVFEAGVQSAADPKYVVEPQRAGK
ncbi:MAG TPA: NrfD/PsrC family molybdoenzyme membrane anchor subunit [Acidimicrobiales bacterium]|jgi:formate-dependent nitrite reductase membrane component NrfD|nr:NrfD/PsrC family molybdoenzyme membrane anchor subunit [Acidimicrobiales bacterium]